MKYHFEESDISAGTRVRNNTSRGDVVNDTYCYIIGYDPGDDPGDDRAYDPKTKERHFRMISLADGMIGGRETAKQLASYLTKEDFELWK